MASEIICIIDRSGSMGSMASEAIGGFNSFLAEQKAVPDDACKFSMVLFDHEYIKAYDAEDIQNVQELNDKTYVPRGSTALFDAMGRALDEAIDRIQKEYTTLPRVAVMVMTDGGENASKDYTKGRLDKLVEDLKKEGWQFVFMSSDLSSFNADLGQMTLGSSNIAYNSTGAGYHAAYAAAASNVASYRSMGVMTDSAVMLNDDGSTQELKIDARDAKNKKNATDQSTTVVN